MGSLTVFLDAYAILAILDGSPAYTRFVGVQAVSHGIHFLEAYYHLLRRGDEAAREALDGLRITWLPDTLEDFAAAAVMRASPEGRRGNLSFADALGYAVALRNGHPFLTGDRGFKGLSGVEFVPAS